MVANPASAPDSRFRHALAAVGMREPYHRSLRRTGRWWHRFRWGNDAMDMAVTELAGNVSCIRLTGRLDAPGADRIGARFAAEVAAAGRNTVVDLSGVSFVASMGLRLLIASARTLDRKGARMALFGASSLVQNVLEQAALEQIIPITSTEQQALARLGS
jgi:anti-sigma B factor antagonist